MHLKQGTHTHAGFPSNKRRGLMTVSGEAN